MYNDARKYLVLLPTLFLLLNAMFFQRAERNIQEAMLQEKYAETENHVSVLAAAVEIEPGTKLIGHTAERNIRKSIEVLDGLPFTFAAAYKPVDGVWIPVTQKNGDDFDPFIYEDFVAAIHGYNSGTVDVGTPSGGTVHLYFQHMPLYSPPNERYLVVTGVSAQSFVTTIPGWVYVGQWASMAVTFILNIWLIFMIVRLGYIYEIRGSDKWRDRRR